jgi:hypothetical protein
VLSVRAVCLLRSDELLTIIFVLLYTHYRIRIVIIDFIDIRPTMPT